jgi:hypothetical protein
MGAYASTDGLPFVSLLLPRKTARTAVGSLIEACLAEASDIAISSVQLRRDPDTLLFRVDA